MAAVAKIHATVRVESETSIGRSYSDLKVHGQSRSIAGLGAKRRALRTKTFQPYADGKAPVLESLSMAFVNLQTASREDILAYFRNTWALTDTIFSALRDDSVFYMVPDRLRRPLIFYFAHPAALYINKMHQAGLLGEFHRGAALTYERGSASALPRAVPFARTNGAILARRAACARPCGQPVLCAHSALCCPFILGARCAACPHLTRKY